MIYSNFRIFFNPPNGLRHRPYSKRPLHSHKLVSIPNHVFVPGSKLTRYNYFFFEILKFTVRVRNLLFALFLKNFFEVDDPGSKLTLYNYFFLLKFCSKLTVRVRNLLFTFFLSWWSNGWNGWWTSDGNWEESSWKLIFKATQNLFEKTSFLKSNKNWYFPTNYLKKFKTIFIHFFILECGREVAVEWNCKNVSFSRRNRNWGYGFWRRKSDLSLSLPLWGQIWNKVGLWTKAWVGF